MVFFYFPRELLSRRIFSLYTYCVGLMFNVRVNSRPQLFIELVGKAKAPEQHVNGRTASSDVTVKVCESVCVCACVCNKDGGSTV